MNPYRNLRTLEKEFDELFSSFGMPARESAEMEWMPSADVLETKDGYRIDVELPGVKKEDVKVDLSNDILTVQGEKKMEKEVKEGNVYRAERSYGTFLRSFRLPGAIESEKVKAEYRNGILQLSIPKSESAKTKQIQIQ
jgi:HSP20 family protein